MRLLIDLEVDDAEFCDLIADCKKFGDVASLQKAVVLGVACYRSGAETVTQTLQRRSARSVGVDVELLEALL